MSTVDYNFEDTAQTPIEKLKHVIKADELKGVPSDFGWLKDILDETLEEYTIKHFNAAGAKIDAHNPLQVESHLAEGSRLLDLCLNQRKEIYQLESQAILSALDICLSQQTLKFDEELAQINLAASVKQAQLSPNDGSAALQDRYKTWSFALIERLKLHNRVGSALNYGERVRFMRTIYVDNLRLAYQRLNAAWRGMAFAFRIKKEEPLYIPAKDSVLDSYVRWLRSAITAVEEGDAHERVYSVFLSVIGMEKGKYLYDLRKNGEDVGYFNAESAFKVESRDFFARRVSLNPWSVSNDGPVETDAVRLLGLDVVFRLPTDTQWLNVAEQLKTKIEANDQSREMSSYRAYYDDHIRRLREKLLRTVVLTPPMVVTNFESTGKEYSWQPAYIRIADVSGWAEGSPRDVFKLTIDPSFQNMSPFGTWGIGFDAGLKETAYEKILGTCNITFDDILLVMKVAVRPSKYVKP